MMAVFESTVQVIIATVMLTNAVVIFHVQPIPTWLARGVITGYRVHVVDHTLSRKLMFPATNKAFLCLCDLLPGNDESLHSNRLSAGGHYVNLAVDARTSVGFNNSLHVDVIHVRGFQLRLY